MTTLRNRVKLRIEELRKSPITLAKSVGLERGFINDILIGRKKSVREEKLDLVAQALECDPAYLMGFQDTARLEPDARRKSIPPAPGGRALIQAPGVVVRGVCQTGVWRDAATLPDYPQTMPISPDIRYSNAPQSAYIVRPHGERTITLAIAIDLPTFERDVRPLDNGMIVVVRRYRNDLTEVSLRRLVIQSRRALIPFDDDLAANSEITAGPNGWPQDVAILAVVTQITRLCL